MGGLIHKADTLEFWCTRPPEAKGSRDQALPPPSGQCSTVKRGLLGTFQDSQVGLHDMLVWRHFFSKKIYSSHNEQLGYQIRDSTRGLRSHSPGLLHIEAGIWIREPWISHPLYSMLVFRELALANFNYGKPQPLNQTKVGNGRPQDRRSFQSLTRPSLE